MTNSDIINLLNNKFIELFDNTDNAKCFFSPGRVNLIGEHTDYNGGHVFPCAITMGTFAIVRLREDDVLRMFSYNFEEDGLFISSINNLKYDVESGWTNYPKGVIDVLIKAGYNIDKGMDIVVYGNIPAGSGLSSSASIEVLTAYIYNSFYKFGISNIDMAVLCQKSENEFIGVKCGIMDQFAIAMGKRGNAIILDTSSLKYRYVPVNMHDMSIVIACTNKKRGLADSKYNERRFECESALEELKCGIAIKSLGDLNEESFNQYSCLIKDEIRKRRARHAVYENVRTNRAVEALTDGDIISFGRLMNESHISLRDDYEVTGKELDTIVEQAWMCDGVVGARMTGAGFGGCAIYIVYSNEVKTIIDKVGKAYKEIMGYEADFYIADIGGGPCEICLNE